MRTTVVLDDSLGKRLKSLASRKTLSDFVNQCLREHFAREERVRRMTALEKSYHQAAKGKKAAAGFEIIETEEWPEW